VIDPYKKNTSITTDREPQGYDYYEGFKEFVAGLDGTDIGTLEDLVAFNKEHADRAIPTGRSAR
jgi:soluble cytochrome b562